MFLDMTLKRNSKLVNVAAKMHREGLIEPDTYVIDSDTTLSNSKQILEEAQKNNIQLYFMLKQVGRNPLIAKELIKMGYSGAVVVDYREASIMIEHNIPLGNVGHLVQTPKHSLEKIISYGSEVFTVMTFEKLNEINEVAHTLNKVQDVILKVYDHNDHQYRGQEGGIDIEDLEMFILMAQELKNIRIVGATAFPAFLYSSSSKNVEKTSNYYTILKAIDIMKNKGLLIKQINMPSTTSVKTLKLMADTPATHGEPGHGLTGTTPMHALDMLEEIPSVVYVTEISHNFKNSSYAYGGGHYRRSNLHTALVVTENENVIKTKVIKPDSDSIDYYFELNGNQTVSDTVIMAFRFQMFVTRSHVALVSGIQTDTPRLLGVYDSLGKKV